MRNNGALCREMECDVHGVKMDEMLQVYGVKFGGIWRKIQNHAEWG